MKSRKSKTPGIGSQATQFKPTHGLSANPDGTRSPTYTAWRTMRQRCNDPKHKSYDRYGGRGITVCSRWDDYTKFLEDMGEKPEGMTLGRIDNNGNYEPQNCRWETLHQQANNRSSNRLITLNGETLTVSQWCERFGMPGDTVRYRLKKGWPPVDALSIPVSERKGRHIVYRVVRG